MAAPICNMTETPPKGSSILDAMPAKVNNGYLLAPPGAEFGTTLTEQMVLDLHLTG